MNRQENDTFPGTHIARTTMDDNVTEGNILSGNVSSTALPTWVLIKTRVLIIRTTQYVLILEISFHSISLTFKPRPSSKGPFDTLNDDSANFEPALVNPMTTSMYIMNNLRTNHPSPFSGKKQAHTSVTKHESSPQQGKKLFYIKII